MYKMKIITDLWYNHKKISDKIITYDEMQTTFVTKLSQNEPFFAGRLGCTETYNMRMYEFGYGFKYGSAMEQLCRWSGFFPADTSYLERFCRVMRDALAEADYIHPLNGKGEAYLIEKYCKTDVVLTPNPACWTRNENPFTRALQGKKILVIHPFADSIRNQYLNREKLFTSSPQMLPEFELYTIKAVQSIAGETDTRFANWFEALDWMCEETTKIDYDVALIGCGAYGFPLAAFCKKQGKSAIHMGGDLQMQFGILGSRWDNHPWVKENVNEYWVRPSELEKPKNASVVETECYW